MPIYTQKVDAVLKEFSTSRDGLTSEQYASNLGKYGPNKLIIKGQPLWRKLVEPFANVFVAVLAVAALISLLTGHAIDAVIIGSIILVSAIIYYVQQYSTERVLNALKKHDTQVVTVLRNGQVASVDSEQLVPGDIVLIGEGEKVPADARLIHDEQVRTNEAMLTGESLPIAKHSRALEKEHPVYEQTNMLFQGSFIISGQATAMVVSTGAKTEFGKLAALAAPSSVVSPAQKKIDTLVTRLITVIAVVVVVVFGLALLRGMELLEALRFVLSLAVAAVPEGLPVAVTVVLVLGMRRLAKYKALARSMKAIENIGIITTIASDKTGTLTKNKLSVQEVWLASEFKTSSMVEWVDLAANTARSSSADPLDAAFASYVTSQHHKGHPGRTAVTSFAFNQELAMSGNVWQTGDEFEVVVKGAPEKILALAYRDVMTARRNEAEKALHSYTGMGYRVIAIARSERLKRAPKELQETLEHPLEFIGFVAIADELRPEAARAIAAAHTAGISVRMITGDHVETAYAIGTKLGLAKHRHQVLDCREIGHMSDEQLTKKVRDIRVFARVVPEAKHRILGILKQTEITAMTGDGVNDVPALTNAHVGIAMGSGSQIAKESGDIVLLDDNFATIITAVEGGRVVYDNIRRMLTFLLTTTLAGVTTILIALLSGLPLPLIAVQILWINLVTDTIFAIPLGLEPGENDTMIRPPRAASAPILERDVIVRVVVVGLVMALATIGIFTYALNNYSLAYAQTLAFTSLVVAQWVNAMNVRSEFTSLMKRITVPNYFLLVGASIAVLLQLMVLYGPLSSVLQVVPVRLDELVISLFVISALVIASAELHKWYCRQKVNKTSL